MKKFLIFLAALIFGWSGMATAYEFGGVDIHGFLSQGYLQSTDNNFMADTKDGTFEFNEMGINFSTDLTDQLRVGMQFFARDLGPTGNDEVKLDWAYIDYRWQDWMGFRFGKMKLVKGFYSEIWDMDMLRTPVFLPQSVYNEVWRDSFSSLKGMATYGSVPMGGAGQLSYDAQIGVLPVSKDAGFATEFEKNLADYNLVTTDMSNDYTYTMALTWDTPLEGFRLKGSFYEAHGLALKGAGEITAASPAGQQMLYFASLDPTNVALQQASAVLQAGGGIPTVVDYDVTKMYGYVASAEYTWDNLTLLGEYTEGHFKGRLTFDVIGTPINRDLPTRGWYVGANYRFCDYFASALSYSEYYPNLNDKDGSDIEAGGGYDFEAWLKTTTLSTRFDINDFWLFKLEASYNDGFGVSGPVKNPNGLEQNWWLFAAKTTVSF